MVAKIKKITLQVPTDFLVCATQATGEGITLTMCRSLKLVAANSAYQSWRSL